MNRCLPLESLELTLGVDVDTLPWAIPRKSMGFSMGFSQHPTFWPVPVAPVIDAMAALKLSGAGFLPTVPKSAALK